MDNGSTPLGFLAGFFGGCIGVILVMILTKKDDTRRGAWIGFGVSVILGIILVAVTAAAGA